MNAPAAKRQVVRLSAHELREGGRVLACTLSHFREAEGALVCAEGETHVYTAVTGAAELFGCGGHLLSYVPSQGKVYFLDTAGSCDAPAGVHRLCWAPAADGAYIYMLGSMLTKAFCVTETESVSCGGLATCAVVPYHERLFAVDGRTVRFGKLLDFSGGQWSGGAGEQGPASFELPPRGGDVVDAFVLGETLYFLREETVTALTAYADPYNFRLREIAFTNGKAKENSAALCCGQAYFFTERGLCRFDGTRVTRAAGAADGEIDLTAGVRASVCGNVLYFAVTKKDGTAALYAYEPLFERGRYLLCGAGTLSLGEGGHVMRDGLVYALGGKAAPQNGRCTLSFTLSFADAFCGETRVESIFVEGEGGFRVTVRGAEDEETAEGTANERIVLASAVRGSVFGVEISSSDAAVRIGAVSVCVRKEDRI